MSPEAESNLLSKIAGSASSPSGADDPWKSLAATAPTHEPLETDEAEGEGKKLASLLQRINQLAHTGAATDLLENGEPADQAEFVPAEPRTLMDAGLSESQIEELILKLLLSRADCVGRDVADHIRLPFVLIEEVLRHMKQDQLVVYRGSASMNDYLYQLTDLGRERARRLVQHCTYFGAAPVTLEDYIAAVRAQSLENLHPSAEHLKNAFEDLLINAKMLARLGPAICSGRGLFLYGAPGNGKTSIAERVTRAFGQMIWIPRAIGVDGEIMRLYDPMNHEEVPVAESDSLLIESHIDRRWVRVRRPTIVVGGELMMDNLEVSSNESTNICEAPVQLKSNCGTLVIDDFGRQRMSTDELLNRWIVPLEKRYDFLNMPNGKKIQVPFDQLIIFSTNLEPRDLVDDAFLRRIPYKIEVCDPSDSEFRELFQTMCGSLAIKFDGEAVDYLIETHFRSAGRPMRCCHPRDLLLQVRNQCRFNKCDPVLNRDTIDAAVENYFAVV